MKTVKKIQLKNGFYIEVLETSSKSNYNRFAVVMKTGEKNAYFGTTFKESNTDDQIKLWANNYLSSPKNQQDLNYTY